MNVQEIKAKYSFENDGQFDAWEGLCNKIENALKAKMSELRNFKKFTKSGKVDINSATALRNLAKSIGINA